MKMGGIMEAHQEVIEDAYRVGNIDYLYVQWKDLVMEPQIRSLKAVVNDMLKTIPVKPSNEVQSVNRPEKQLKEYPEIFGINVCCEITRYKKNTIYKLTSKGTMPYFRPGNNGRKLMFRREEVSEWMTARRQETTEEFINSVDKRLVARKTQIL